MRGTEPGKPAHVLLNLGADPPLVTPGPWMSPTPFEIGDVTLSRSDVVGAATSVAGTPSAARSGSRCWRRQPTASPALAITGCLIAGVPVVPVPADVGQAERRHILTDSGAQGWLGPVPDASRRACRTIPVRMHARHPGIASPSRPRRTPR